MAGQSVPPQPPAKIVPVGGPLPVILAWAVLFLPPALLRGPHYEEGRRALAALDSLTHGHWLVPEVLGNAYLLKPPLMSAAIAMAMAAFQSADPFVIRVPALLATLAIGLGAYCLAREVLDRYDATLAGLVVLLTPMVLEKGALAETDTALTAFTLWAFVVWRRAPGHWWLSGALLALGCLVKGPVALGFFVGAVVAERIAGRRNRLLNLALCLGVAVAPVGLWAVLVANQEIAPVWLQQMRLDFAPDAFDGVLVDRLVKVGELIAVWSPWCVAASAMAWRRGDGNLRPVLLAYWLGFSAILAVWPLTLPRYFMPAVPAMAVLAAMALTQFGATWPRSRRIIQTLLVALVGGQLLVGTNLVRLQGDLYAYANRAGRMIAAEVPAEDVLYVLPEAVDFNLVFAAERTALSVPHDGSLPPRAYVLVPMPAPDWIPDEADRTAITGRRGRPFALVQLP